MEEFKFSEEHKTFAEACGMSKERKHTLVQAIEDQDELVKKSDETTTQAEFLSAVYKSAETTGEMIWLTSMLGMHQGYAQAMSEVGSMMDLDSLTTKDTSST